MTSKNSYCVVFWGYLYFFFHRVIYLWTKSSLLSRLQRSTTKVEVVLRNNFASIFIRIASVTGFCFSAVKETSTKLFSPSTFLTWLAAHFLGESFTALLPNC